MANKSEAHSASPPFFPIGKEHTGAMFETQKEVPKTYDEVGRAWIERVKPEVALWSELATKLSASRTMPAGLQTCQNPFAQRRQMVAWPSSVR
jgi:hypothetical protein